MLRQTDRQTPVVRAIYQRLTNGNPLVREAGTITASIWNAATGAWADAGVPVFQAVPKDLTCPFIAVQDLEGTPWGSKTAPGESFVVNLLIISDRPGYKELSNIANAVLVKLTRTALELSTDGLRVVVFQVGAQVTAPLSDGRTVTRKIPIKIIVEDLGNQDPQYGG